MKNAALYVILVMLLAGCQKKKYPQPSFEDAGTFSMKMLVNGQAVEMTPGKNGYFMYSSYTMDTSGVYNLIGEFKQEGCTTCANSIRFQVNDAKVSSPSDAIDINNALKAGNYSFLDGDTAKMAVNFTGSFNKPVASVLWDFGDRFTSTEMDPRHVFRAGKHRVSITVTGTDRSQSTLSDTVYLFGPTDLNARISASVTGNTVSFTPHITGGKAPYRYAWSFGDGAVSSSANPFHTYAVKGGYASTLRVTDSLGKSVSCRYNLVQGGDLSASAANFSFSNITGSGPGIGLSGISIQYTDASGAVFNSIHPAQPLSSSFEILSVEDFEKNENGQPVKKVKLKFNCTLYNGSRSVLLQGTEVTVGFAYK